MNAENAVSQHRFWGETTAFLALFLDNVGVLIFFSAILVFTFNYPADIILTRMIPGHGCRDLRRRSCLYMARHPFETKNRTRRCHGDASGY